MLRGPCVISGGVRAGGGCLERLDLVMEAWSRGWRLKAGKRGLDLAIIRGMVELVVVQQGSSLLRLLMLNG